MEVYTGIFGLLFAISVLVVLAYRGHSIIIAAPVAAMTAVFFSYGIEGRFMARYTISYMEGFANYARNYFPIYLFGAVFAKLMDITGCANSIAEYVTERFGKKRAVLSVVITCAILTYGGVSLFVVAFVMLPIALRVYQQADLPKRLIPGAIALGSLTFTMSAMPGTPQVQNTIPMQYFGTDSWAAPVLGITASALMFGLGMLWLDYSAKKSVINGEHYSGDENTQISNSKNKPAPAVAFMPVFIIMLVNFMLSKIYYPNINGSYLKEAPFNTELISQSGNWSVLTGLLAAIIFLIAFFRKSISAGLRDNLKAAAESSFAPLLYSCAVVGFGAVTRSLEVFDIIEKTALGISSNPLVGEVLSVNILSGMTASASGGLGAALEALAPAYMASGISPEVLHRIASVASGGLDSLPYNGATITILALFGMTHRESYGDMCICTVLIPTFTTFILIILVQLGICF